MIGEVLILVLVVEVLTVLGRKFICSAPELNRRIGLKVRVHHGYIGLVLLVLSLLYFNYYLFVLGWVLFLSDFVHHFIVLPIWKGSTEFP